MATSGRIATWLELAVAPQWRRTSCRIRVHAVGGKEGGCFAISMNERWLCSSSGGLTVFCGLGTARRFLKLLRIEKFEQGESPDVSVPCDGSRYCLRMDNNNGLRRCLPSQTVDRYAA